MNLKPNATITCDRCPRKTKVKRWNGWNATFRRGVIVGFLCPNCQTPEENAEAEINEATITYGTDAFGRVIGKVKGAS